MALQSPLARYKGHQECGYEHRYGISASRFPGRLLAAVCLCYGSRYLNTLLPLHRAPLMGIRGPGSFGAPALSPASRQHLASRRYSVGGNEPSGAEAEPLRR